MLDCPPSRQTKEHLRGSGKGKLAPLTPLIPRGVYTVTLYRVRHPWYKCSLLVLWLWLSYVPSLCLSLWGINTKIIGTQRGESLGWNHHSGCTWNSPAVWTWNSAGFLRWLLALYSEAWQATCKWCSISAVPESRWAPTSSGDAGGLHFQVERIHFFLMVGSIPNNHICWPAWKGPTNTTLSVSSVGNSVSSFSCAVSSKCIGKCLPLVSANLRAPGSLLVSFATLLLLSGSLPDLKEQILGE